MKYRLVVAAAAALMPFVTTVYADMKVARILVSGTASAEGDLSLRVPARGEPCTSSAPVAESHYFPGTTGHDAVVSMVFSFPPGYQYSLFTLQNGVFGIQLIAFDTDFDVCAGDGTNYVRVVSGSSIDSFDANGITVQGLNKVKGLLGACCEHGPCRDGTTQEECNAVRGHFYPNLTCAEFKPYNCPAFGAGGIAVLGLLLSAFGAVIARRTLVPRTRTR